MALLLLWGVWHTPEFVLFDMVARVLGRLGARYTRSGVHTSGVKVTLRLASPLNVVATFLFLTGTPDSNEHTNTSRAAQRQPSQP
jgi:hypothetical protein